MFSETESKQINTLVQTERHSRLVKPPDSRSVKLGSRPPAGNLLYSRIVRGYPLYPRQIPEECLELGTRPLALTFQFVIHYNCSTNPSYSLEFLTVMLNEPKMVKMGVQKEFRCKLHFLNLGTTSR
jgi:hypothetical protein